MKEDYNEDHSVFSNYDITENISCFYTSATWNLSSRMSLYLGARYEHTHYKYVVDAEEGSNNYGSFAPSFSFNWKVSDIYDTSLKLSSEDGRPSFYFILPGKTNVSDNEYSEGNIKIMPEKRYKLRWENLLFHYVSISASVMWTKDFWESYYGINEDNIRYSTYDNLCDLVSYIGNLSVPFAFLNNKIQGSMNLSCRYNNFYNFADGVDETYLYGKSAWQSSGNLYIGYEVTDRFSFYLNPYYSTKSRRLQVSRSGYCSMGLGMEYKMLKNKALVLSLTADDVFNQESVSKKVYYGNKTVSSYSWPSTQNVMLTLSYTWNRNGKSIKVNQNSNDTDRFTNGN